MRKENEEGFKLWFELKQVGEGRDGDFYMSNSATWFTLKPDAATRLLKTLLGTSNLESHTKEQLEAYFSCPAIRFELSTGWSRLSKEKRNMGKSIILKVESIKPE